MKLPLPKENVFLINLDRSPDRLKMAKKVWRNENVKFTKISAIDGRKLSRSQLINNKYVTHGKLNSDGWNGTIAAALSHLYIYQRMVDEKMKVALVLEDDSKPEIPDFWNNLKKILKDVPKDWNMINLTGALNMSHPPGAEGIRVIKNIYKPNKILCPGMVAYLIKLQAAKALLKHIIPMRMEIDFQIREIYDTKIRMYIPQPPIISHRFELVSDRITKKVPLSINDIFGKIYVINLRRAKKRWLKCHEQLKKYKIKGRRFNAISGSNVDYKTIKKYCLIKTWDGESRTYKENKKAIHGLKNNKPDLVPRNIYGMIGCQISQIRVWEEFSKLFYKWCLILEDDFKFMGNINKILESTWNNIPNDSEIVFLGWSGPESYETVYTDEPNNIKIVKFGNRLPYGLHGYCLNIKAINKLLKVGPTELGVDISKISWNPANLTGYGIMCNNIDHPYICNEYIADYKEFSNNLLHGIELPINDDKSFTNSFDESIIAIHKIYYLNKDNKLTDKLNKNNLSNITDVYKNSNDKIMKKIFRMIINNNEKALIVDDNFNMQDNFIEKIKNIKYPKGWSIIYLDIPKDINKNNNKYFKKYNNEFTKFLIKPFQEFKTCIINKEGAKYFLNYKRVKNEVYYINNFLIK